MIVSSINSDMFLTFEFNLYLENKRLNYLFDHGLDDTADYITASHYPLMILQTEMCYHVNGEIKK